MAFPPSRPVVEHHREPFGIGEARPRISWTISAPPWWRQAGYELEIVRGSEIRTHVVRSAEQILLPWPEEPLASRERATIRVRVEGADGSRSEWSPPTEVEAGLLDPADWSARPVGGAWPEDPDSDDRRPALVRRAFDVSGEIVSARVYASAHGLYELEINGARVGDDALSPGWTVYPKRLRYYTYDVTALLRGGENVIGGWLGDGWYRGRLGWRGGFRNLFGPDLSLIAQLEIHYADGRTQTVATDADWLAATGPIVRTGNYDGEDYDARDERAGWSSAGYDPVGWTPVAVRQRDPATLVAPTGPPVRCTEEITPVAVLATPSGKRVLDFGQNLVGRLRIRVRGERGAKVVIRTAEVLQDGELYQRPLRDARSTDSYVLAGRPEGEEWEPRFTFHGFRYAEIEGPDDLDAIARVYHSDLERTGWFSCSDPLLERLHENVVWSMRGNFVDIPTDCPQRDERVGWTGDLQVFAPTAAFLHDVTGMLSSWLRDVAAEQLPDGTVPWYVPVIPAHEMWTPIRPGAAWGDVATLTPWALYERTGDTGLLEAQYESARAWVDLVDRLAGDDHLWNTGFQLGDWLDPSAPPDDPAAGMTDKYLVATAYFAASSRAVARMAAVLGREEGVDRYGKLADAVAEAFCAAYVLPGGRMVSDSQTAYSLAIGFDLLPSAQARATAGARLAELVAAAGNRIATGFVGTPLVTDALSSTGELTTAYDLLLERECPSWLYPVTQGATTIWERWDSLLPDGRVNPGSMTSFNHYALGAVADWLHRVVAGLTPAAPGYREVRFAPRPGGGLTRAEARHRSPYGMVGISWELVDGELTVVTELPTGTTGVLDLDGEPSQPLGPGTHRHRVAVGLPAVP
ncbi:alpha-L-rhamnosidase [Pseudonocardia sp. DSM 110487]|uniref:alpha-L-rhamnosidase n=1 Tax=Pseudonocardia sp. DSM 110487 TaxID=2865833 RepID=UPI002107DBEC|nr:alpha-L-rhamnosidase [Pseudonocardia sp. DSM 110487]